MTDIVAELIERGQGLPPTDRWRLVDSLLDTFGDDRPMDIEASWSERNRRFGLAFSRGEAEPLPTVDLLAEATLLMPDARDIKTSDDLLAESLVVVGIGGRTYSKSAFLKASSVSPQAVRTPTDFRYTDLAPDLALMTYRVRLNVQPSITLLRSSIWRRCDAGWQLVFHQSSTVGDA